MIIKRPAPDFNRFRENLGAAEGEPQLHTPANRGNNTCHSGYFHTEASPGAYDTAAPGLCNPLAASQRPCDFPTRPELPSD